MIDDKEVYAIETEKGNYNHIEAFNFLQALEQFDNKIRRNVQDFSEIKNMYKFSRKEKKWFEIPLNLIFLKSD